MKTVIASTGNSLESKLDKHFARCAYFVVYDSETKGIEFIPNPNQLVQEGAGSASVELINTWNVDKIISGEFGLKIKPLLDKLKIQMIVLKDKSIEIKDIIHMLNH
jgi:predicted Fe-Mo cluster-binding NifX family protein